MSFSDKKRKKDEQIDFNAYGLKPTGFYLDSLRELGETLDHMENSSSSASDLLNSMDEAEKAARRLLNEGARRISEYSSADEPAFKDASDAQGGGTDLADARSESAPEAAKEQPPKTPDLKELLKELDSLVGLEKIKKNVKSLINLVKVRKLREENGLSSPAVSLHLVFMGNPGTGKTTVARLIGKLYHAIGVLSSGQLVEVDRSGLVAGYVGQTAIKTGEVIKRAMGGVLFIDEAYSLAASSGGGPDFGQEAIETILKAMEDNRDDFVVIVAGYEDLMEKFINSNPGLESRFNRYFLFEDYNGRQLYEIFVSMCGKNQYKLDPEADKFAKEYFERLYLERDENFGNARDVRNVFENVISIHSDRVAAMDSPTKENLMTILKKDIEDASAM